MVALNRKSKVSTASALSKYLRQAGFGGVSYYGSALGEGRGEIVVEGDGVFCIGASIRYWAPPRWRHQDDKWLGEVQDRQADICQALEESGRYAYKAGDVTWDEGVGYTFKIHVESLKHVRTAGSEWKTCFSHLR